MSKKLVKCKTCGADIAKDAKVCPSCGAKHKKGHPILGIILVLFGLCVIGAALGGGDSGPKIAGSNAGGASSISSSQQPSTEPSSDSFQVGDQVELNDIVVTLTNVSENSGSEFNKPSDGNVFAICSFEIENNSSKDIAVSSILSFEAYVDDYSTSLSLGAIISTDKTQLDGSVAAGKKMSGVIGYEIPKDWSELEINFTPDFWSGKEIKFIATK